MIIRNLRKSIPLQKLEEGAVFQKGDDIYIKTDMDRVFSSPPKVIREEIACVNLENGHFVYFSINEVVYFYGAELIL